MRNILVLLLLAVGFSSVGQTESLKMMTYNIRYDNLGDGENTWSKRNVFLSDQVIYNQPDIVGIQEGLQHQVQFLDSVFVDYAYFGVGRDDGKTKGEYSAIFYNKEKLTVLKEGTFWLSETPDQISVGWDAAMERICTFGLFKNKTNNQQFWVFNTHFDHIGTVARVKSAALILQKVAEFNTNNLPVIVMGDFNLKPDAEPIQLLSKTLNDSKTASIAKPFGPSGTYNAFQFNKPVLDRIDYIFTSKGIDVLNYAILSDSKDCKYPSDHLPVLVELKP